MDWFSEWQPAANLEIERIDPTPYLGQLTAWLILIVVAAAVTALWYRQRSWRRSFWCASVGRDVEVRFRLGCAVSCSAFEDPTAIACARRCLDRSFRVQWPPALPVLPRPRDPAPVA
jgi:hypothetical protein